MCFRYNTFCFATNRFDNPHPDGHPDGRVVDVPALWREARFDLRVGQINSHCHQLATDAILHYCTMV